MMHVLIVEDEPPVAELCQDLTEVRQRPVHAKINRGDGLRLIDTEERGGPRPPDR